MSPDQRSVKLKKLLTADVESLESADQPEKITFLPHIPGISENDFQKMQKEAVRIFNEGHIQQIKGFKGNHFSVYELIKSVLRATNVEKCGTGDFKCSCGDFKKISICRHSLAVAKSEHEERDFVDQVTDKMKMKSLADVLAPKIRASGGGDKPTSSKRRGPSVNADRTVVSMTSTSSGSFLFKPDLGKLNALLDESPSNAPFTEIHHNDSKFHLIFIDKQFSGDKNKHNCKTCSTQFQRNALPPEDIAILHLERYYFPTGPGGSWQTKQASRQEAKRFIHARYKCVLDRYPYFKTHMLEIPNPELLSDVHWNHLWEQLAVMHKQ